MMHCGILINTPYLLYAKHIFVWSKSMETVIAAGCAMTAGDTVQPIRRHAQKEALISGNLYSPNWSQAQIYSMNIPPIL